jgi:cyanophycinase
MPRFFQLVLLSVFLGMGIPEPLRAQYEPNVPEPISKIRGSLLLHGGGPVADSVRAEFVKLAGGNAARIVVIPTADVSESGTDDLLEDWNPFAPASVSFLNAETRAAAMRPFFSEPLAEATGVWICGGKQSRLGEIYADTPVEVALRNVIARGGVVGGTSAGAAIMTRIMIVRGEERKGFDLFPGAIIDQHFLKRNRQDRLLKMVAAHPERVGLGIDEETALILRGRSLNVIGDSEVVVCLAASKDRPVRVDRLTSGKRADLIALSRAAVARTQPPFPPAEPAAPIVEHGSLVIVGGGGMSRELVTRFIELAGGPDSAIVVVPCSEQEIVTNDGFIETLRKAGATNLKLLHTKDRERANSDDEFLAPLRTARGIWFGGGRQWNLVDSYQNTTAHKLMHDVLARGGVIGGSSAGASIQGDYMPRGNPLGNLDIMAEGYERGLGFLTGVAIDQHFSQRKRFADMTSLVQTYPQLLGIGIDEATAIIVQKSQAEVAGKGNVAFYDAHRTDADSDTDYVSVSDGQRFDLKTRRMIEDDAE